MFKKDFLIGLLLLPLKIFFRSKSPKDEFIEEPKSLLILWPNTSLGLLITGRTLFSAIRNKYPSAVITLIVKSNLVKNLKPDLLKKIIGMDLSDQLIIKNKLKVIFNKYDILLIPSLYSFSVLPHLTAMLVKSKTRIGVSKIDKELNPYLGILDKTVEISWMDNPDIHFSELLLRLLEPLGYNQKVTSDRYKYLDVKNLDGHIGTHFYDLPEDRKIILINNQPEEVHNRWGIENLVNFIGKLVHSGDYYFFYIEDKMESAVMDILEKDIPVLQFVNKNDLVKIIHILSICDLVVSCNSDIMHLAGLLDIPQVSIFGDENPFNFSPIGYNKKFVKESSGLIDEISGDAVFEVAQKLLNDDKK
jgi:heptosyltransferase-2